MKFAITRDSATNGTSLPNIYFTHSTDGGVTWSNRLQVNVETNGVLTDQWQPALTVKPDGTQLFIGWYDRRNDPASNALIQTYGVFTGLPVTNASNFAANFLISTVQFPAAFSGTQTNAGTYDPAYPPFLAESVPCVPGWFARIYANHMADYDTATCDDTNVWYAWGDNRRVSTGENGTRNQADVRVIRMPWPQ